MMLNIHVLIIQVEIVKVKTDIFPEILSIEFVKVDLFYIYGSNHQYIEWTICFPTTIKLSSLQLYTALQKFQDFIYC